MKGEQTQKQSLLKQLITLGKEQGYLTYADVNDYLPESITDTDQVEDIVDDQRHGHSCGRKRRRN